MSMYSDEDDYTGGSWRDYVTAKAERLGLGTVDAWHDIDSVGVLIWRAVEAVEAMHTTWTLALGPGVVSVVSRLRGGQSHAVLSERRGTRLEGALACLERVGLRYRVRGSGEVQHHDIRAHSANVAMSAWAATVREVGDDVGDDVDAVQVDAGGHAVGEPYTAMVLRDESGDLMVYGVQRSPDPDAARERLGCVRD